MLWVNLIMDTFAAMALASLPPDSQVMQEKPREYTAFIISPDMKKNILCVGDIFFLLLIGLAYVFEHTNITSLSQILSCGSACTADGTGFTPYKRGLFLRSLFSCSSGTC